MSSFGEFLSNDIMIILNLLNQMVLMVYSILLFFFYKTLQLQIFSFYIVSPIQFWKKSKKNQINCFHCAQKNGIEIKCFFLKLFAKKNT